MSQSYRPLNYRSTRFTSAGFPPFPAATICLSRMCVRGALARLAESMMPRSPSQASKTPPEAAEDSLQAVGYCMEADEKLRPSA